MMRYSVLALTLIGLVGCQQDMRLCAPTFHVPRVTHKKPILSVIPIFDQTKHHQPWNVADHLTAGILRSLSLKDELYMVDQEKLAQIFKELQNTGDFFGTDVQWIKKKFRSEEFVAFIELIKHEETLLNFHNDIPDADCPAELFLSARIRIFDLRNPVPKLVLSEVVNHSENLPKEFNRINRPVTTPDQEGFQATPLGIAHDSFAKEIAERIEDYVLLAQTR